MPSPDAIRLRHMREAAATAVEMAAGHDRADLSNNVMLTMAVTRCLEILGEAASKISPDLCQRLSLVPFPKIVSMRNRLIHAYFDIDLDIVYITVTEDLPNLISLLDEALRQIES